MAVPSTHARRGLIAFLSALALAVVGLSTVGRTQGAPQTPAPPATGGAPQGAAGAQGERGAAGAQGGERGGGNRGAAPGGRAGGPGLADAANVGGDYGPKPPVTAMSPEEEAKRFILPPGYHLELVLSDPDIVSPAAMAFDGNGRLYVAEFRSYMLDVDAGRQHEPTSRISMHESTRRDGKFDRHTVFADNLLVPRMVLPLDKRHPHERDAFRRRADADRYRRRRRRGQEAGLLHGRRQRAQRQHAAGAERLRLGARQLDLQHLQRLPLPLDAARNSSRAVRASRRRVGHVDGRRREDLAGERGRRARARPTSRSRFSTARSW